MFFLITNFFNIPYSKKKQMFNPSGARGRKKKQIKVDSSSSDSDTSSSDDTTLSDSSSSDDNTNKKRSYKKKTKYSSDSDSDSDQENTSSSSSDSSSDERDIKKRKKTRSLKSGSSSTTERPVKISFTRSVHPNDGTASISYSDITNQINNIKDYYVKEVNIVSSSSNDIPLKVWSPTFNQTLEKDAYTIPRGLKQDTHSIFKVDCPPSSAEKIKVLVDQYGKNGELIKTGATQVGDSVVVPRKIMHPETKKEIDHPIINFMSRPLAKEYHESLKRALDASQRSNVPAVLNFTLNDVNSISSSIEKVYKNSIPPDISKGVTLKCKKSDAKNKSKFDCQLDIELIFGQNNNNSLSSSSSSSSSSKKTLSRHK